MKEYWKKYIEEKILESEIKISKLLLDFSRNLEIVRMDYDEFHDEDFSESDFGIYYFDLKWNEKLIYDIC